MHKKGYASNPKLLTFQCSDNMATSKSSSNMKPKTYIATVLRRLQNEEVSTL